MCCNVLQCVAVCYNGIEKEGTGDYTARVWRRKREKGKFINHSIEQICVLQCVVVRCSVMQCVVVRCSVLQCVVVCCSVLQCVAACCSVLQCAAVCCSVLQCVSPSK